MKFEADLFRYMIYQSADMVGAKAGMDGQLRKLGCVCISGGRDDAFG